MSTEEIRQIARDLDLHESLPDDDAALERATTRARITLAAHVLGWRPTDGDLSEAQQSALSLAVALQTIFHLEQGGEDYVGVDERVTAVSGLTFAQRPAPRVSEAAREALAGAGLIRRSGTVRQP